MENDRADVSPATRVDTVLTAVHSQRLHVQYGDRPLCAASGQFRSKPLEVYPPTHREWCRECLRLLEDAREAGDLNEIA